MYPCIAHVVRRSFFPISFCSELDCLHTSAGKLLGRSNKIAYNLLHKIGPKGDPGVKPGDRVGVFVVVSLTWKFLYHSIDCTEHSCDSINFLGCAEMNTWKKKQSR